MEMNGERNIQMEGGFKVPEINFSYEKLVEESTSDELYKIAMGNITGEGGKGKRIKHGIRYMIAAEEKGHQGAREFLRNEASALLKYKKNSYEKVVRYYKNYLF